jgi:hypothetical protein
MARTDGTRITRNLVDFGSLPRVHPPLLSHTSNEVHRATVLHGKR